MTTIAGGLVGTGTLLGTGVSTVGVSLFSSTTIVLSTLNFAYVLPRNAILTSISASFATTLSIAVLGNTSISVEVQVFQAPSGSTTFTQVPTSPLTLSPALTGTLILPIAIGTITTGSQNLSTPFSFSTGDQSIVFGSCTASGVSLLNTVTGNLAISLGFS